MSKCIAEQARKQTAAALEATRGWSRYAAFIGLDVHKETIAEAAALLVLQKKAQAIWGEDGDD
jgi:hypothetical protein